jgi:hypothetical protein
LNAYNNSLAAEEKSYSRRKIIPLFTEFSENFEKSVSDILQKNEIYRIWGKR